MAERRHLLLHHSPDCYVKPAGLRWQGQLSRHWQNNGVGNEIRRECPRGFVGGGGKVAGDVR